MRIVTSGRRKRTLVLLEVYARFRWRETLEVHYSDYPQKTYCDDAHSWSSWSLLFTVQEKTGRAIVQGEASTLAVLLKTLVAPDSTLQRDR